MKKLPNPRSISRLFKSLLLLSTVVAAGSAGGLASAQIVKNGSFESSANSSSGYGQFFTGNSSAVAEWTRGSSNYGDGIAGSGTAPETSSGYSAPPGYSSPSTGGTDPAIYYFVQNYQTPNNNLYQDVTLAADTSYTLTFAGATKVRDGVDDPLPEGFVTVTDNDGTLANVAITTTSDAGNDFVNYTATFITGSDTTGAVIDLGQNQANPHSGTGDNQYAADFVDFSNVAINPTVTTPEPSAIALMLGGLGLLVARQLRRRNA